MTQGYVQVNIRILEKDYQISCPASERGALLATVHGRVVVLHPLGEMPRDGPRDEVVHRRRAREVVERPLAHLRRSRRMSVSVGSPPKPSTATGSAVRPRSNRTMRAATNCSHAADWS